MIWLGPGVLKFGTGKKAVYIEAGEKIPDDKFGEMKSTSAGMKNVERLIEEKKLGETAEPKIVAVKKVKKSK